MREIEEEIRAEEELESIVIEDPKAPETEEKKKKKRRNRAIIVLIFIAVNVLVIGYTALNEFGNKPAEKLQVHFGVSGALCILAAVGCLLVALAFETIKYLVMMKSFGAKLSVKAAFQTAAIGKYYDNITPSGIGGQPFQIYTMHKFGYSTGESVAMPLIQFLTMQTAFIFLAIVFIIFKNDIIPNNAMKIAVYFGVFSYSTGPLGVIFFTVWRRACVAVINLIVKILAKFKIFKDPEEKKEQIIKYLDEYRASIVLISKNKGVIIKTFILSVCYQLALFCIPYFILLAFNGSADLINTVAMVSFVYCACTFIPTPGNAGAAEGAFYLIFSQLDPTGLFWSMLVWRGICFYAIIALGIGIYGFNAFTERKKT